jgi:aspartyl-tRNA(Asn)/glutamyl-tRNA(Gln) amidotransferase subunit C
MAITREEVEHVARLARLELTDEEIETFRGQLDAVLERAQRIQALDLDDVPPTSHPVELTNVWRADVVEPMTDTSPILDNAPLVEDGKFRVPQILEDAEEG